ncbi:MAG: hypothetical protein JJE39_08715 [Vicinamibacteria bacterium]|nr:hypothetical protein [Vicinamibacteria bacterium]
MTFSQCEDPDVAYFRDIERTFVERRGDPLFISNADWVFLARLRKKGVPMRVVLRGITDAFDAHAHSFARKQKIRSLKFCENEITAAADRYRRALQAEGPSRRGLGGALEQLESHLAALRPPPEIAEALAEARQSLLALAQALDADQGLDADKALVRVEDRLVAAASLALGPTERATLEQTTRDATAAYESRMPAKVYETLIGESVRRKILHRFSLPRLLLAGIE